MGNARGWAAEQWLDWQRHSRSFDGIAAYHWLFNFLVLRDGSQSLQGMVVTRGYFRLLGLKPLIGRTFSDSETAFPPKPVIVLGFHVWQQKFGGDPAIIGKKIRVSRWDTPPQVIGVMPPDLRFLPSPTTAQEPNYNPNATVDFWVPGAPDPKRLKEAGWNVVARLKEGIGGNHAQGELAVTVRQEAQQERDYAGITPRVEALTAELNRDGNRILWPLLGAAVLVLLIACGNTGSLMLVRGIQRQQEYSIRSAPRSGPDRTLVASVFREFADRARGRHLGRVSRIRPNEFVEGNRRSCHPASGCSLSRMADSAMRPHGCVPISHPRRACSRVQGFESQCGGGAQERRTEEQHRKGREKVLARGRDHSNCAHTGFACGRRTAREDHEKPFGSEHRVRRFTHSDHECHGRTGQLERFSPARAGAGVGAPERAICGIRMGRSAHRQQLARHRGN